MSVSKPGSSCRSALRAPCVVSRRPFGPPEPAAGWCGPVECGDALLDWCGSTFSGWLRSERSERLETKAVVPLGSACVLRGFETALWASSTSRGGGGRGGRCRGGFWAFSTGGGDGLGLEATGGFQGQVGVADGGGEVIGVGVDDFDAHAVHSVGQGLGCQPQSG